MRAVRRRQPRGKRRQLNKPAPPRGLGEEGGGEEGVEASPSPREGKKGGGDEETEPELRAVEAEKARLQQQREREDARAQEESERRGMEATAAAMEEAKRKIHRETPPGGS